MSIRYIPRMQRAFGVIFLLAGLSLLLFVFPNRVLLQCDRQQNRCSLEQSNLVRAEIRDWAVQDMMGARLEVMDASDSGTAFKIWIMTRSGSEAFTPYGIGGSREKKQAMVAKINSFIENPGANELDVLEDERIFFYTLAAGLICFGLLPLLFARTSACRLDPLRNTFLLTHNGIGGLKTIERRLSDLVETSLAAEVQGGFRVCRVVFAFHSGERVPLTYYRYANCKKACRVVKEISDFIGREFSS